MPPVKRYVPETPTVVPEYEDPEIRPRLSLTSDVLDYRLCRRKYGFYKVRGYSSSSPAAEFVGTFAHRSIESAWRHFVREDNAPSNAKMANILEAIRQRMVTEEGRRPHSWHAAFQAGCQVMRMNRTVDTLEMYPTIVDSERTIRVAQREYVIEGVVDMILANEGSVTLWDFKAARDPRRILSDSTQTRRSSRAARRTLSDHTFQLRLYYHLYASAFQETPALCQIVFLGEIPIGKARFRDYSNISEAWSDFDARAIAKSQWEDFERTATGNKEPGLLYSVQASVDDIRNALADFNQTAKSILDHRVQDYWPAPEVAQLPRKQTCEDCDFYRSCPTAWPARSS